MCPSCGQGVEVPLSSGTIVDPPDHKTLLRLKAREGDDSATRPHRTPPGDAPPDHAPGSTALGAMSAAMHRDLKPTVKGNPAVVSMERRRRADDQTKQRLKRNAELAEKGSLRKRIFSFVLSFLLFGAPVIVVQYCATLDKSFLHWVDTLTVMLLALVGGGLLASSLVHGFRSFLLAVCLPSISLAAVLMLNQPLIGLALFFLSHIYVLWFVLVRVQYWSFKGLFIAYLIVVWITGPYYLIPNRDSMYADYAKQIDKVLASLEKTAYD